MIDFEITLTLSLIGYNRLRREYMIISDSRFLCRLFREASVRSGFCESFHFSSFHWLPSLSWLSSSLAIEYLVLVWQIYSWLSLHFSARGLLSVSSSSRFSLRPSLSSMRHCRPLRQSHAHFLSLQLLISSLQVAPHFTSFAAFLFRIEYTVITSSSSFR